VDITEELIMSKIYIVRNRKIMPACPAGRLDRDLAILYGVETKRLKEAVRRNEGRFPEDFMFEMTTEELENWRTQFASSNSVKIGLRYRSYSLTE
jgi:hypothetical protein